MTPVLWKTKPVTSSSLSAKTCLRSITPSPFVSERIEMVSSGSRACARRLERAVSFHGGVFGTRRPLGYSGVSETHSRPFSSQSMFIALAMSGSAATSVRLNSGCTSIFAAAFAGRGRPAFGIAQGVAELAPSSTQLVDVRALARPRDAAQQDRAVVRAVEVLVEMPGDRDERAVRRAAAVDSALVGPHLRLDVVDADLLAAARQLVGAPLEVRRCARRPPSACTRSRGCGPRAACPCRSRSRRPSPSSTRPS